MDPTTRVSTSMTYLMVKESISGRTETFMKDSGVKVTSKERGERARSMAPTTMVIGSRESLKVMENVTTPLKE